MMAKQIAKDDLNAVTAADTAGFSTELCVQPIGADYNCIALY